MPEITDNTIKRKHKEFDARIQAVLLELRGKPNQTAVMRLRQSLMSKLQTMRGAGGNR